MKDFAAFARVIPTSAAPARGDELSSPHELSPPDRDCTLTRFLDRPGRREAALRHCSKLSRRSSCNAGRFPKLTILMFVSDLERGRKRTGGAKAETVFTRPPWTKHASNSLIDHGGGKRRGVIASDGVASIADQNLTDCRLCRANCGIRGTIPRRLKAHRSFQLKPSHRRVG